MARALLGLLLGLAGGARAAPPTSYCAVAGLDLTAGGPGLPGLRLASAAVVARHGDRTPANVLPGGEQDVAYDGCAAYVETVSGDTFPAGQYELAGAFAGRMWTGGCADGELTSRGAEQHAGLGAALRERYVTRFGLIPPGPEAAGLVDARSTDVPRTRASAEHLLAKLLPDAGTVELRRRPMYIEDMVGSKDRCPRWWERYGELVGSARWKAREAARAGLRTRLDDALGTRDVPGWGPNPSIDHYFDALRCRKCHAKALPPGVTERDAEALFEEGDWEYATLWADHEFSRLSVGGMLYELARDLFASHEKRRFHVRVAHDTTVAPLLGLLGVPSGVWVNYASYVLIEHWVPEPGDTASAPAVRILFNGAPLRLPACGSRETCTVGEFEAIAAEGEPAALLAACAATVHSSAGPLEPYLRACAGRGACSPLCAAVFAALGAFLVGLSVGRSRAPSACKAR